MGILCMLVVIAVECGCEAIVTIPVRGVNRPEGGVTVQLHLSPCVECVELYLVPPTDIIT